MQTDSCRHRHVHTYRERESERERERERETDRQTDTSTNLIEQWSDRVIPTIHYQQNGCHIGLAEVKQRCLASYHLLNTNIFNIKPSAQSQ